VTEIATRPNGALGTTEASATGGAKGVTVTGLFKAFGRHAVLRGVDLAVPDGTVTAILGPSGSGKTTLLRILAGFVPPDGGTICIGGTEVDGPQRHVAPEVRRVGYVPQEGSLFPHLDVEANVAFGVPRAQRRAKVAELLEMTGISELAHRYPHQLSGGQQQRVALARALAPSPSLVLLDEPFSSLDAALRASVRLDVTAILRQAGTTTVIVTHDQDEALSMADQVAVLRHGQVAQAGRPEQVYDRPVDADLSRFVGEANLLAGSIRGGRADTILGSLPLMDGPSGLAEGTAVLVLVRPEQIQVVAPTPGGGLAGIVRHSDYHGHDSLVTVATGNETLNVRCTGSTHLSPGADVALEVTGAVVAWAAPTTPAP